VLRAARALSRESRGVFDVTVNTWLRQDAAATTATDWRAIIVSRSGTVRRLSDVRVDLGGIAKGFAVDCAIDVLRRTGVTHAVVNAGGDLRVLGRTSERVLVRHPANPAVIIPLLDLTDGAVCTSANYLDAPGHERLRRPDGRALAADHHSISVCAPSCMIADALTKIVAAIGVRESRALLERHRASALVLSRNGRMIASDPASHAA
jgi:thiamine biosynthesis lipoprotein